MKKIIAGLTLLTLILIPLTNIHSQGQSHYLLKVKAKDKFERSVIANTGAAIEFIGEDHVIVIANLEEKNKIARLGWIVNQSPVFGTLDFPVKDSEYHNYDELITELKKLHEEFPAITELFTIGKSFEGREIMGIRISGQIQQAHQLPAFALMGGHHAREHLSVEIPLRFARYLLERNSVGDFRVRKLINTRDIQIVPAINPDGLEFDVSTGSYKMWRKNRRKNNDGTFGVDLNRNYGYKWGTGGSSTSTSSDTYMGVSPFSEPETKAVKQWIENNKNINILLTTHTFSELILYPWGHTHDPIKDPRDRSVYQTMANTMAQWNGYKPQQSSGLYIASGDTTDWSYAEHGIFSFTFELDPKDQFSGGGFYPGVGAIPKVLDKNIEPLLYMIEYADDPYRVLAN